MDNYTAAETVRIIIEDLQKRRNEELIEELQSFMIACSKIEEEHHKRMSEELCSLLSNKKVTCSCAEITKKETRITKVLDLHLITFRPSIKEGVLCEIEDVNGKWYEIFSIGSVVS